MKDILVLLVLLTVRTPKVGFVCLSICKSVVHVCSVYLDRLDISGIHPMSNILLKHKVLLTWIHSGECEVKHFPNR